MSGYIGNIPVPQATQTRQSFTATASQTTFNTAGYSPGYIDVFLNGVKLAPADYTATNGSDVVLAVGAASGDILETVAYEIFQVLDQDFTGDFTVDGSTFVVDSTNNRVGIGTSSPKRHLHINDPSAVSTKIQITNSATGSGSDGDGFQLGIGSAGQAAIEQRENQPLTFSTNNTERMRISGTGHVLVGQSSTLTAGSGNTVTGFSIRNDGGFYASRSSGGTINANTNTDGEIALFRKDGSTVGVIGTVSSELFIGTGSSGFYFDASNTSIKPRNVSSGTGSAADGTIDLGGTGNRFKDAHFSGTVNSGGLTVDGGTAYKKLISTFPSTYKTNLQVGQQAHISNDAITDTLSIENTGTAGATNIQFSTAGSERMRINASGDLLVGTSSDYAENVQAAFYGASNGGIALASGTSGLSRLMFADGVAGTAGAYVGSIIYSHADDSMRFNVNGGTERMRIDSNGGILIGTTDTSVYNNSGAGNGGVNIGVAGGTAVKGLISAARDDGNPLELNRLVSDGGLISFSKDGTTVGSIKSRDGNGLILNSENSYDLGLALNGTVAFYLSTTRFYPNNDNFADLGTPSLRFDDIYATNGTIQTSDQNEKQQIASLTDAEITAAKAISKLFKTFKWNDSVAEKGDAARTHSGVIAQEVEQAMTDAGLNAGDYAFFISTIWWEADGEIYETLEEAPEGATERNKKGIRYPELLSFIGAATEQRLASIETRLDALEAN